MQELGDDDKENIRQTIDDEILHGAEIRFRLDLDRERRRWPAARRGGADAPREDPPAQVRHRRGRRRQAHRQRRRQADGLGDDALLDALRRAQGRRRGRGCPDGLTGRARTGDMAEAPDLTVPWDLSWRARPLVDPKISSVALGARLLPLPLARDGGDRGVARRRAAPGARSGRRDLPLRAEPRRRPRGSVPVDGLGVEPALDPGWERARAVRVERDLLDRLELPRVAAVGRRRRRCPIRAPPATSRARHPRGAGPCSRILPAALTIAASVPSLGLALKPCPLPNRSVSAGTTFTSSAGTPSSSATSCAYSALLAVGLGRQAEHHLAGRVNTQKDRSVRLVSHRRFSSRSLGSSIIAPLVVARRCRSWCAVSALCSSRSQNAGCGPPIGCAGTAGRSQPG